MDEKHDHPPGQHTVQCSPHLDHGKTLHPSPERDEKSPVPPPVTSYERDREPLITPPPSGSSAAATGAERRRGFPWGIVAIAVVLLGVLALLGGL